MNNNTPWVALFSQTGSEIAKLSEHLRRWPDYIITNADPDNINDNVFFNKSKKYGKVGATCSTSKLLKYSHQNHSITTNPFPDAPLVPIFNHRLRILFCCLSLPILIPNSLLVQISYHKLKILFCCAYILPSTAY